MRVNCDCYWYAKYQDMNMTIPFCEYDKEIITNCPLKCKNYLNRKQVDDHLRAYGMKLWDKIENK